MGKICFNFNILNVVVILSVICIISRFIDNKYNIIFKRCYFVLEIYEKDIGKK